MYPPDRDGGIIPLPVPFSRFQPPFHLAVYRKTGTVTFSCDAPGGVRVSARPVVHEQTARILKVCRPIGAHRGLSSTVTRGQTVEKTLATGAARNQ